MSDSVDRVIQGRPKSFCKAFTKGIWLIYKGEEHYSGISVMDEEFKSRRGENGGGRVRFTMNNEAKECL